MSDTDMVIKLDEAGDTDEPGLTIYDRQGVLIHRSRTWEATAGYMAFALDRIAELEAIERRFKAMVSKVEEADQRFGHFAGLFGGDMLSRPTLPALLLAELAGLVREAKKEGE